MATDTETLKGLFARQSELNISQARIGEELVLINQKILYLLSGLARPPALTHVAPVAAAKFGSGRPAMGARRRSWFERGEALKFMRRVAKRPMRPAKVVHAIMDAKGYSERLDGEDRKRAEAALHQAVIAAVKAGALDRDDSGNVRLKR